MSIDYTDTWVAQTIVPRDGAIANGTVALMYIGSKSFNFKSLHAQVAIMVAATSATQSFQLQASDAAGSFLSPTSLATCTILSSHAAGTMIEARVADASTDVAIAPKMLRLAHVATAADATLKYTGLVTCTAVGY